MSYWNDSERDSEMHWEQFKPRIDGKPHLRGLLAEMRDAWADAKRWFQDARGNR